jgi:serine/threonine-protein kinase
MIIAERYRLERKLGEGGFGVVWAATHLMMKTRVALKFLKATKPEAVKRFLREARVTSGLRHPNIVAVHDLFILPETQTPVMVMDGLVGQSLGARLRAETRLSCGETARLLLPVVQALGAAHTLGVVHRDLKPENVFLVGEHGAVDSVRVLDFGLAKLTASEGAMTTTSRLTQSGVVMGTPQYLAPEQLTPDGPVDHAVDVWALGVVIYECVAGFRPFEGRGLPQLFQLIAHATATPLHDAIPSAKAALGQVPRPLSTLVSRMLDKSPAARPQLLEICDVLTGVAAG